MKRDFKMTSMAFFKIMMKQTQKLLHFQLRSFNNSDEAQVLLIKRSQTVKLENEKKKKEHIKTIEEQNQEAVVNHLRAVPMMNATDYESIQFSEVSSQFESSANDESVDQSDNGLLEN